MTHGFAAERVQTDRPGPDLLLIGAILLLLGVGVSMLFTSSYVKASQYYGDPLHFLRRQLIPLVLGLIGGSVAAHVSLKLIQKWMPAVVILTVGIAILPFVPGIGQQYYGASRWITVFGQSFQPSELVKLTIVLYLAFILSRKAESIEDPVNSLLPPVIIVAIFGTLVYLQNDFSTAFFVVFVALVMFFIADVPMQYFVGLGFMTIPLAVLLLLTREHRVRRILAFLDPERDPVGAGYQILAAREALQYGSVWGVGVGRSTKKLGGLPEAQSDFVFAIVGEELGFMGVVGVMALFVLFAVRGYQVAYRAQDRFVSYAAFGLTSSILLQALLNLAVVAGMVPATGIPLPFFSAGGSSILIVLVMAGLLVNCSRRVSVQEEAKDG
ncbi:MAG: putative lipid II flippase FtsW [Spirochaetaceae bacterium]